MYYDLTSVNLNPKPAELPAGLLLKHIHHKATAPEHLLGAQETIQRPTKTELHGFQGHMHPSNLTCGDIFLPFQRPVDDALQLS